MQAVEIPRSDSEDELEDHMDSVMGFAESDNDRRRGAHREINQANDYERLPSEVSDASFNYSIYQPSDEIRGSFAFMPGKTSMQHQQRPMLSGDQGDNLKARFSMFEGPEYKTNERLGKEMKEERQFAEKLITNLPNLYDIQR